MTAVNQRFELNVLSTVPETQTQTLVLALRGRVDGHDIRLLCHRMHVLLAGDASSTVLVDVAGLLEPDLTTVDGLARLQLTARRHDRQLRLRRLSGRLRELLALTGLDELMFAETVRQAVTARPRWLGHQ